MTGWSIDAMLDGPVDPPFRSSFAVTNAQLVETLGTLGHRTRRLAMPRLSDVVPLDHAAVLARTGGGGPADLALYDDAGLAVRPPSRLAARRTAVLFHGAMKNPGSWLGNPEIDLFIANSPYMAHVLTSLLTLPDWRERRCLDPRAFGIVTDVRLPLPCVADEDGLPGFAGADLPADILKLADQGVVLGHCLQPQKIDWFAAVSVMFHLNLRAREAGAAPVRLLVCASDLTRGARADIEATLDGSDFGLEDLFLPAPYLAQPALFALMRRCRFGLAYNAIPDSFGFYVLESVHNLCPVYTNGIGNNRYLLGKVEGITVIDDPAVALEPDSSAPYEGVADAIFEDLGDPGAVRGRCDRGRDVIRATWTRAAFADSLAIGLERLDRPPAATVDFESLVVGLSPLVRRLDLETGAVLCDSANQVLTPARRACVASLLGRRCADLPVADTDAAEDIQSLFREGVLALKPGESIEPSLSGPPEWPQALIED